MAIRLVPEYFPEENIKYIVKFFEVCLRFGVTSFSVYDCENNFEGLAKGHYRLLDILDGQDDIVEVICRNDDDNLGTFYFNMENEGMEIFHDYTDNEFCNQVYELVEKEIEQNDKH